MRDPRRHTDAGLGIVALEADVQTIGCLADIEVSMVVLPGENSAADQRIEARVAVPPRDENAFLPSSVAIPFDGKAMRGVLRSDADAQGDEGRSKLLEPDQADAGHRVSMGKLGSKRRWKQARGDR